MPTPELKEFVETREIDGFNYSLGIGVGKDGQRTVLVGMRQAAAKQYLTIVEMDVDAESYWKDTQSGVRLPETRKPPEPPTEK